MTLWMIIMGNNTNTSVPCATTSHKTQMSDLNSESDHADSVPKFTDPTSDDSVPNRNPIRVPQIFTCETLGKMYIESPDDTNERIVDKATSIQTDVILRNSRGIKTFTYVFFNDEDEFVTKVVHILKEVFVDAVFVVDMRKNSDYTRVSIDWSRTVQIL
jgi:hypothetical protein